MSLHDPKSKVALVTSNDQKSKGSLCLNHLDNMAPVDMVVVSHYLQGFIHVRWLALGFLFTIDLVLHDWTPKKKHLGQFLFKLADPRIRSQLKGPFGKFVGDVCFSPGVCFLNVVGHFDEVLCLCQFFEN